MNKYKIPIAFTMIKTIEVIATSESEAEEQAFIDFCKDPNYLSNCTYVEDSFCIDGEVEKVN